MGKAQAAFYVVAIILLVLAACPTPSRVSLGLLGAAAALLAYSLPTIVAA